ncbi:MAG TPA: porin [Longimicrobiales bacterium]|nr:porin [Longimicrobiales bacterium]
MHRFSTSLVALAVALSLGGDLAAQATLTPRSASIRIGGRMHTQYATSSVESYNSQFFFRRARIEADITVNDFFEARLQPEFGGFTAELKDAYVKFNFSPAFQLTVGQFKRPFDLFELASSVDLSIIERDGRVGGVSTCAGVGSVCSYSRLTERLGFADRDIGVRVGGARGKVAYEVSMTNGAGQNVVDENDAKSFSGRMSLKAGPDLTLGANLALHDYVDPAKEDAHAGAWGVDAQYGTWRDGLLVQASLVGGENWKKLDTSGDASAFMAFQGAASWYAPLEGKRVVGIEPLLRVSFGDPDRDVADDGGLVFTPGLMLYIAGRNKIGFNVDVWSPQTGKTEHSLKVQSYLYF